MDWPPQTRYPALFMDIRKMAEHGHLVSPVALIPYYQKDGITIYHADCRDILHVLPSVDLVVTDPPYGMEFKSNHRPDSVAIHGDDQMPLDVLETCREKAACGVYWFCRWDNLADMPKPKSLIAWVKNNWSMGDLSHEHGRQWEGIAFYPGPLHRFIDRIPDVFDARRIPGTQHPTQKPIALLTELISCNKCNVILDPFCGTGSTLLAARDLGKRAIGIEYEFKYCRIAVERLSQGTLWQPHKRNESRPPPPERMLF